MTPVQLSVITQLRHNLHQHPELSMQEKETMKILQTFLRENTSLEIHIRDGWFYALKKGLASCPSTGSNAGLNRTEPIAFRADFRADMDALPIPESIKLPYESQNEGISHKCGHDGHCAVLCGLALELDSRETDRDVYLIFQPGEEIGAGARQCAELIREKGITEIYAMHNLGGYPEGSLVYRRGLTQPASEGLRICLTGKTSHASAPEKGNNPAGAVASIVQYALRAADSAGNRVHGISEPSSQTPEHDLSHASMHHHRNPAGRRRFWNIAGGRRNLHDAARRGGGRNAGNGTINHLLRQPSVCSCRTADDLQQPRLFS